MPSHVQQRKEYRRAAVAAYNVACKAVDKMQCALDASGAAAASASDTADTPDEGGLRYAQHRDEMADDMMAAVRAARGRVARNCFVAFSYKTSHTVPLAGKQMDIRAYHHDQTDREGLTVITLRGGQRRRHIMYMRDPLTLRATIEGLGVVELALPTADAGRIDADGVVAARVVED